MIDLNEVDESYFDSLFAESKSLVSEGLGCYRIEVEAGDIVNLITRLREAERDAARYRWLRDNCTTTQADCLGPIFVMTVRRKEHLFNVGLSIDQAMKEKGCE